MSKKAVKAPVPDEADEHAGKGGSYVINPEGKRDLVERTKPADEATQDKEPQNAQA